MAYSEKDEEEENFEALCDGYETRIAAQKEEIVQLRSMVSELVDVYWGEGDSDPRNPPDIIKRAKRLLKS